MAARLDVQRANCELYYSAFRPALQLLSFNHLNLLPGEAALLGLPSEQAQVHSPG